MRCPHGRLWWNHSSVLTWAGTTWQPGELCLTAKAETGPANTEVCQEPLEQRQGSQEGIGLVFYLFSVLVLCIGRQNGALEVG